MSKRVHFFLMRQSGSDTSQRDGEMERVFWCSGEEAIAQLSFQNERDAVQRAIVLLTA